MKIESSVYNRLGILNQAKVDAPVQKTNIQQSSDITSTEKSLDSEKLNQTKQVGKQDRLTLKNYQTAELRKVSDVLTEQESTILRDLFPNHGSQWGVAAYRNSPVSTNESSLGLKIDLTT